MTEEHYAAIREILIRTWGRDMSADEAFDLIEDIILTAENPNV